MDFNTDFLNQLGDNINPIKPLGALPSINSNTKKYVDSAKIHTTSVKKNLTVEQVDVLNSQKRERILKSSKIINTSDYSEYNSLNISQIKSLEATNYWRVLDGLSFINVPIKDVRFWTYFDERCFILSEQHQINTKEAKNQAKVREANNIKELNLAIVNKKVNVNFDKFAEWNK